MTSARCATEASGRRRLLTTPQIAAYTGIPTRPTDDDHERGQAEEPAFGDDHTTALAPTTTAARRREPSAPHREERGVHRDFGTTIRPLHVGSTAAARRSAARSNRPRFDRGG
jgi:hypothetical protein